MKDGGTLENSAGVSLCSPHIIGDPGASITDASTSTNGAICPSSKTSFSQKSLERAVSTGHTDIKKDECKPKHPLHDSNEHEWQGSHKNYMPSDSKEDGNGIGAQATTPMLPVIHPLMHTLYHRPSASCNGDAISPRKRSPGKVRQVQQWQPRGSPVGIDDKHEYECPAK